MSQSNVVERSNLKKHWPTLSVDLEYSHGDWENDGCNYGPVSKRVTLTLNRDRFDFAPNGDGFLFAFVFEELLPIVLAKMIGHWNGDQDIPLTEKSVLYDMVQEEYPRLVLYEKLVEVVRSAKRPGYKGFNVEREYLLNAGGKSTKGAHQYPKSFKVRYKPDIHWGYKLDICLAYRLPEVVEERVEYTFHPNVAFLGFPVIIKEVT